MNGRRPTPSEGTVFREVQRPWAGLLILSAAACLLVIGVLVCALIQQLVFHVPCGDRPMSDKALAIFGPAMIVLAGVGLIVACTVRLVIEVRHDGLYVQYRPLHPRPRKIDLTRVASVRTVSYHPVVQYGGWGIRWTGRGKAYNVRGHRGVRLDYTDGRHLLLGSQRPGELAEAIERLR